MKVIVSFENRVRPDSTGVYLVRAFKQLGHEVAHVYPDDIKNIVPGSADLYVKCDDGLMGQTWNPDLHPSAYYVIDTHIESDWRVEFAAQGKFDLVGCCQSAGVSLPWTNQNVFHLPCGCDPELHYVGDREKIYDGCFIGHFHTTLGGKRIETVHAFFDSMEKPYFGERTFKEMAEKYAQSKLVLNQAINKDVNMRVFEAMCSGSCLVQDREAEDLDKLGFIDGVHYAGYSSLDELRKVTKELLQDDDKREGIARNGRRIATQHTYAIRMKTILERMPQLQEIK